MINADLKQYIADGPTVWYFQLHKSNKLHCVMTARLHSLTVNDVVQLARFAMPRSA